jgi:dipeptidyl aminopeptidase/acylaminoacyl peptidase
LLKKLLPKTRLKLRFLIPGILLLLILAYIAISVFGALHLTTNLFGRDLGAKTPADYALSYENISFQSVAADHSTLRGWWLPNQKSKRSLILVHGQNSSRASYLPMLNDLWDSGYNLLLFDSRGHGQSDGWYHTYGLYEQQDIVGAVKFLKDKGIPPASIGILGQSLGASIAIMGMSQTPDIKAGISESGFANWAQRTRTRLGFFYPGVVIASRILLNFEIGKVQPLEAIKKLDGRHLLLIHGDKDSIIPVQDAYDLKAAAGSNVNLWIVPEGNHVDAYQKQPAEYLRRLRNFFDSELAP